MAKHQKASIIQAIQWSFISLSYDTHCVQTKMDASGQHKQLVNINWYTLCPEKNGCIRATQTTSKY